MWTFLFGLACTSPEKGAPETGQAADSTDTGPAVDCQADTGGTETGAPNESGDSSALAESGETASPDTATETGDTSADTAEPVMVADFSLTDINPSSPRCGEVVSPRDYLEQVSGWYFTHAT